MIKWPGGAINPGRSVEHFATLADFAPTILEIAGVKADRGFAGMSLVPFIRGEIPENWRDAVFTQTNGNELYGIQRSVMTKEWKYVYNGFDYDELYNLESDPAEMINLINDLQYKPVVEAMCKRLWQFARENRGCVYQPLYYGCTCTLRTGDYFSIKGVISMGVPVLLGSHSGIPFKKVCKI